MRGLQGQHYLFEYFRLPSFDPDTVYIIHTLINCFTQHIIIERASRTAEQDAKHPYLSYLTFEG